MAGWVEATGEKVINKTKIPSHLLDKIQNEKGELLISEFNKIISEEIIAIIHTKTIKMM